jgi:hypothetical protein
MVSVMITPFSQTLVHKKTRVRTPSPTTYETFVFESGILANKKIISFASQQTVKVSSLDESITGDFHSSFSTTSKFFVLADYPYLAEFKFNATPICVHNDVQSYCHQSVGQ